MKKPPKMTWHYKYIRPSELAAHRRDGWQYVGKMRPDNWASPNHDSIIVRKRMTTTPAMAGLI